MLESTLTDERVRLLADEVLARSRYDAYRRPKSALQELVERVAETLRGDWLPDWLLDAWEAIKSGLLSSLEGLLEDTPLAILARFLLAGAIVAAAAAALAALVRALRGTPVAPDAARPGDRTSGDAVSWIAQAEGLAGAGRFLEAAHCTQLAALQLLLSREWLALGRSEPNRTLRRRLREARLPDSERADFLALLDRLESRWFRDRAEDRDLYGAWRGLHARLEALVQTP